MAGINQGFDDMKFLERRNPGKNMPRSRFFQEFRGIRSSRLFKFLACLPYFILMHQNAFRQSGLGRRAVGDSGIELDRVNQVQVIRFPMAQIELSQCGAACQIKVGRVLQFGYGQDDAPLNAGKNSSALPWVRT